MRIPYRTQQMLIRIGSVALILLVVGALIFFCWFTWLERFVVYTRDGAVLDMNLYAAQKIAEAMKTDNAVHQAYFPDRVSVTADDFLVWIVESLLHPRGGRHAELLNNPEYVAVLNKYK